MIMIFFNWDVIFVVTFGAFAEYVFINFFFLLLFFLLLYITYIFGRIPSLFSVPLFITLVGCGVAADKDVSLVFMSYNKGRK